MEKSYCWDVITHRLQSRLEENVEQKFFSQMSPSGGSFGSTWAFKGGRRIRIEAQSTNVLGFASFKGHYQVYALNSRGGIEPNFHRGGGYYDQSFGSHVKPMGIHRRIITTPLKSDHGYYWKVEMRPVTTTDNQGPMFFRVYADI